MGAPLNFEFDDSGPPLRSPTFLQSRNAFDGRDDRVPFILSTARLDDNYRGPVLSRSFRNAQFNLGLGHPADPSCHAERRLTEEGLPGPGGSEQQPAAPAGFVQPRLDFSVTYSMAGNSSEGIVPTITVGNVYAIAREGAFTGDQYGPKIAPQDVKEYFAQSPQGAQMLMDNQRELAHKFGPPSVAFQDFVGVQEDKVAFWVSEKAAVQACSLQNIFSPVTSKALYKSPIGGLHNAADRARKQLNSTRRKIPRLPIFLLPSQYWLPRRPKPSTSADNEATQLARDRLRRMGLPEETVSKVHVHSGQGPRAVQEKKPDGPQKGLPLALPLVHVLNYLQDRPPWCCFASNPAQARGQGRKEQAQNRQGGASISRSASDSRMAALGKEASLPAGSLPVFRIPGLSLMMPTSVGHVDLSPVFLSKEQLLATWAAIRGMHYRWVMGRRKSERKEVRQLCELVAARLAGVAPPALPPQQAAGSEDEEGMDEPPEVRDFLQELGEGGGRPARGDDAASGVLPTGPGAVLVTAAVGAFSLGAHAAEWACDAADTLFSKTPVGRKTLGLLSEPAEPDGGQSHNAEASSSSMSDHEGNSNGDTACSGPRSGAAAEHSALGDAMGSSKCSAACSDPPPEASIRKGGSRVRALLSRLRRRREKPAEQLTKSSSAADEHAEADVGPPADLELPASASPLQDSLSTAGADTAGPSTSENNPAAYTAGSASCSDGTGASGLGNDPQMTVDWGELNSSMMHSLHAIISDLITAAVAKSLGMPVQRGEGSGGSAG
ncbi:hypothetical protein WJX75_002710 [Coccomyxa subellipsoidea]|uniref:Uncharacterized protein n=1 Tax=Coccomyxa subellipsoidea TaxID=248742 RepID=A0ABR2YHP0_9CHLO